MKLCHCAQVGVSPTDAVVAAEIRVKNFDCHFLLLHCLITLQKKDFYHKIGQSLIAS